MFSVLVSYPGHRKGLCELFLLLRGLGTMPELFLHTHAHTHTHTHTPNHTHTHTHTHTHIHTHTQVIPTVSSVPFYSTLIPLVFVLTVTAVKDAYDDIVSPLAVEGEGGGRYADIVGPASGSRSELHQ